MPLRIPSDYAKNLIRRWEMTSLACEGMEGPGEPHLVTQRTLAVDGVLNADCTRSPDRGDFFFKPRLGWSSKQHKSPPSIS